MSEKSTIEWTDATWPIVLGCQEMGPGCSACYAVLEVHRKGFHPNPKVRAAFEGLTERKGSKNLLKWNGKVRCLPERLNWPVTRFKKPSRIFVTSMGDLHHDDVPVEFLIQVYKVMEATPQHTYQVLTKRAENLYHFINQQAPKLAEWKEWPLPNVWLGVSTENQMMADRRIPWLLNTDAVVKFLSCEPLLGPLDLKKWLWTVMRDEDEVGYVEPFNEINWIIAGGESGPKARPAHPDWFRDLQYQCEVGEVAFFFKQYGNWLPSYNAGERLEEFPTLLNKKSFTFPDGITMWNVGKKSAGRELDGRTWDEMPLVAERAGV
jgi:protein gp37